MVIKQRPVTLNCRCIRCGEYIRYHTVTYEVYNEEGKQINMYDDLPAGKTNYMCLKCQNKDWKEQLERGK